MVAQAVLLHLRWEASVPRGRWSQLCVRDHLKYHRHLKGLLCQRGRDHLAAQGAGALSLKPALQAVSETLSRSEAEEADSLGYSSASSISRQGSSMPPPTMIGKAKKQGAPVQRQGVPTSSPAAAEADAAAIAATATEGDSELEAAAVSELAESEESAVLEGQGLDGAGGGDGAMQSEPVGSSSLSDIAAGTNS